MRKTITFRTRLRVSDILPSSFLLLAMAGSALGYFETDMPNLKVPSNLKPGVLGLDIEHRLLPQLMGADIILGLRYCVWSRLEVNGAFARNMDVPANEFDLGASYACHWGRILRAQADVQFLSYKQDTAAGRASNLFGLLSIQSEPLWGILTPVVNLGYDGERKRAGVGAGANIGFRFPLGPIQRLDLSGEFSPLLGSAGPRTGRVTGFTAGLTFETYGHHFAFTLGNSLEPGARRFLAGAANNDLHFGFNIHRFLDLKSY